MNSERGIVALGLLPWVQKIIDFSVRAEYTIISDALQGTEDKGVNNTEMVLALMIPTYYWQTGKLK